MSEERKVGDYKDLLVWQKGIALTKLVYEITRAFPADERFGLVTQMRRAAVSIVSNIAEGQARRTTGEFIQFHLSRGGLGGGAGYSAHNRRRAEVLQCTEGDRRGGAGL